MTDLDQIPSDHTASPQTLDYASPSTDPRQPFSWMRVFEWMIAIAMIVFVAAIFLPALGPSGRVPAYRAQCGANLHQITVALIQQAQNNGGQLPDSFESAIIFGGTMSPERWAQVLVCPQSHDTPSTGTTAQQIAANLHSLGRPMQFLNTKNPPTLHVSYIYLGKGLTVSSGSPRKVLVFEPPEHHVMNGQQTINVAWTDGWISEYTLAPTAMQQLMAEFQAGQNPPATLKAIEHLP